MKPKLLIVSILASALLLSPLYAHGEERNVSFATKLAQAKQSARGLSADAHTINQDILLDIYEDEALPLKSVAEHIKVYKQKIDKLEGQKKQLEARFETLQIERDDLFKANVAQSLEIDVLKERAEQNNYALKTLIKHALIRDGQIQLLFPDDFTDAPVTLADSDGKNLGDDVYTVDHQLAYITQEIIAKTMELARRKHAYLLAMDEFVEFHDAVDQYRHLIDIREYLIWQEFLSRQSTELLERKLDEMQGEFLQAQDRVDQLRYTQ